MGGRPKGLLLAPPEADGSQTSVIARTIAIARAQCDDVVLVGRAEAYASLGVRAIEDDAAARGEGPLAGLAALLDYANGASVIAIACDMPYVTAAMLARLASYAPDAAAVAPRDDGHWSPLFARYDSSRVAAVAHATLASGARAMRAVLEVCDARELPLSPEERAALRDWDAPGDIDAAAVSDVIEKTERRIS